MLYTIHEMLAAVTKTEELALDRQESKALADSIAEVGKHYDVKASPVVVAWTGLALTLGGIYGPRLAAIKIRRTMERARAREEGVIEGVAVATASKPDPFFGGQVQERPDPFQSPHGQPAQAPDPFFHASLHATGENIQ